MYNIEIYAGKASTSAHDCPDDGLAAKVVKSMRQPLYNKGHHVYMDNYFSSVSLAKFLLSVNTYMIGTARVMYKGWPKEFKDTEALNKQMNRGDDRSVVLDSNVECLIWKDKKAVAFVNTVTQPGTHINVTQRNKDGSRSQVSCPESVKHYNAHMGGVDLFDSRRKIYSCSRKSKKWWLRLFYFLVDTTVVNSYIMYTKTAGTKQLTLKDYIISLSEALML